MVNELIEKLTSDINIIDEEKLINGYVESGDICQTLIPVFIAKDDEELKINRDVFIDKYGYLHINYLVGKHIFKSVVCPEKTGQKDIFINNKEDE